LDKRAAQKSHVQQKETAMTPMVAGTSLGPVWLVMVLSSDAQKSGNEHWPLLPFVVFAQASS
jgi:hypothetical protein